jgi:hydroxymethylbilane synthase
VAALATIVGAQITLRAELLAEDGSAHVSGTATGDAGTAEALAQELLDRAPPAVRRLFAS